MKRLLSIIKRFIPAPLFERLAPFYHLALAVLANSIYRFPGRKLIVIGVTGTDGKSTTAILLTRMLEAAGRRVGLSSTVLFKVGTHETLNETNMTVLGRFQLPRLLRQMVDAGAQVAVVEVTSHSLIQRRVWGIPFDVAVFTNLSQDHLDYHKTMEAYREAKGRLFASLMRSKRKGIKKTAILNYQDSQASYFASFPAERRIFYGVDLPPMAGVEVVTAEKPAADERGVRFLLRAGSDAVFVESPLLGSFNVMNITAASAAALAVGVPLEAVKKAAQEVGGIPGRLERIAKDGVTVVVDYAHTPDALKKLYPLLRSLYRGKLIAVFGATGDRDRSKRPVMGSIADALADVVILTTEEPYTEDPRRIIAELREGVTRKKEGEALFVIPERRAAIVKALELASPGDVIALTGMGHQRYAAFGEKKIPWNDAEAVRELLADKKFDSMKPAP